MLALPAPVPRSPMRLRQSAQIRSSTSSTRIGTLTTPMATIGCTPRAQLFSLTRTRESTSLPRRELRVGASPSRPPSPPGALPAEVFEDERTVQLNGTTIALKHYAPAHTDSDISVLFTAADIFHVADTFWNGYYPFIDYSTGGSIDGMIRATEANLAKVTESMIGIPGHG